MVIPKFDLFVDHHFFLWILSDDATHIEKTAYIIEKCIKITVDPLKYGIGDITI